MTTVEKIKAKILDLAIRGKLVPQDPNDEPASELLKRIRAEKEELVKAKKIKKEKNPSEIVIGSDGRPYEKFADGKTVCIEDEVPFALQPGWAWARLKNLSESIQYGYNAPAKVAGRIRMVRITDIQNNGILWGQVPYCDIEEVDIPKYLLQAEDLLFARTGGTVGKSYLVSDVPEAAVYAGYLIRTRCAESLLPQYAKRFMESACYWTQLRKDVIATAQPNCNGQKLGEMLIPLPPLAEQKRIVSKIEEQFAEVEKISAAVNEITRTAERINKKVLDLAMRGQLVPQDPNDEPAEKLLKRIAEARQHNANVKSRKSKCDESVIFYGADRSAYETRNGKTVCIDDEIPFETPVSWAWTRLGDIFQHNTGKALNRNSSGGEFKEYITTSNVYWDEFKLDTLKSMRFTEDELDKCTIKEGDLLVCEGGDIGRAAIWNLKREVCIQNHLHRLRPYMEICRSYFCFALRHYKYTNRLQGKGIGLQGFSSGMLHILLIPFPPLAEQKRIVAKIEEVRKLTRSLTT